MRYCIPFVIRNQSQIFDFIQCFTKFDINQTGLDQLKTETGNQTAMCLDGEHFIGFLKSHECGSRGVKHRVAGAIACAICIA